MKHITLLFSLIIGLLLPQITNACPIWYVGKIKIVDQNFKEIESVKLCKYNNYGDSFFLTKSYRNSWKNDSSDGKDYRFWNGGYRIHLKDQRVEVPYKYKITAKGYADLYLNNITLKGSTWSDSNSIDAVLYIVMPTKKFITRKGKTIMQISYRIDKPFTASDTAIFNIQTNKSKNIEFQLSDYIETTNTKTITDQVETSTDYATDTYPNPVKNTFQINIPNINALGQKVTFFDLVGKEIKSLMVYNNRNTIELDWLQNGTYLLVIYDKNGNGIHKEKLLKI